MVPFLEVVCVQYEAIIYDHTQVCTLEKRIYENQFCMSNFSDPTHPGFNIPWTQDEVVLVGLVATVTSRACWACKVDSTHCPRKTAAAPSIPNQSLQSAPNTAYSNPNQTSSEKKKRIILIGRSIVGENGLWFFLFNSVKASFLIPSIVCTSTNLVLKKKKVNQI